MAKHPTGMPSKSISLNKYVSSTGRCSRREADRWIDAGRLHINGTVAVKGNRVEAGDTVTLDGKVIGRKPPTVYLMLHKPAGITSTTDPKDPDNIISFINFPQRIFPIGRLDKASTGLILLTNDGDIVNQILRAENEHEKEYIVTVDKPLTDSFLRRMSGGLPILGTQTKPCQVERLDVRTFRIVLTQGLNRQIRRMCDLLGFRVRTLKRIRIMNVELSELPVGAWRELSEREIGKLMEAL